ncbi:MAG: glycosyltransferase family 2 protein [Sinobacterium sp.]|nr:glycosyltransferase family 2 protein [Sinobacterium sp.]
MLSIVIPLYNEEASIDALLLRLDGVFNSLEEEIELVLVDDGSSDSTWAEIERLSQTYCYITGLKLSRNFGHQGALLAGLSHAKGDAVISMDGDLQHPPEVLPELISRWKEGAKVVATRRHDSADTSFFKRNTSRYFYKLFSTVAESEIQEGESDFRLLDRTALDELLKLKFGQPFLRGAVQSIGFKKETVDFDVEQRFAGESKYTLSKMLSFARSGLISHSSLPLKFGIWLGLFTSVISLLELIYIVVQFFIGNTVPGWASTIGFITLFSGMMFFLLGVIGLYIEDIHTLLKDRPHYIIEKKVSKK